MLNKGNSFFIAYGGKEAVKAFFKTDALSHCHRCPDVICMIEKRRATHQVLPTFFPYHPIEPPETRKLQKTRLRSCQFTSVLVQ